MNNAIYKISLLGEVTVGKSTLALYLKKNEFLEESVSTVGMHFIPLKYKDLQLNIWDTSGQERFKSITKLYYRNSTIIILVYDLSKDFVNGIENYLEEIRINTDNYKILLVGNKADLIDNYDLIDSKIEAIINKFYMQDKILDHVKISCKNLQGRELILDKIYNYCKKNQNILNEPVIVLDKLPSESSCC